MQHASFTGRRSLRRAICRIARSSFLSPPSSWTSGRTARTKAHDRRLLVTTGAGVLGELYGGAIESRFARDLPEVGALVRGEAVEPITIVESSFQANRLLTLRTRNSSAYKGLYALLVRDGGRDFRTGEPIEAQTVFDDKIDIHHIFPEKWWQDRRH